MYYNTRFTKINKNYLSKKVSFLINLGFYIILFLIASFFFATYFISIDSSLSVDGYVVVLTDKKKVFLREGIINNVLVKNGDIVQKGQPLFSLDNTKVKVDLENLIHQIEYNVATDIRLLNNLKLIEKYKYKRCSLDIKFNNTTNYPFSNSSFATLLSFNKIFFYFYKDFINNSFEIHIQENNQINSQVQFIKKKILYLKKKITLIKNKYATIKAFYLNTIFTRNYSIALQTEIIKHNNYLFNEQLKLNFYVYKTQDIKLKKLFFLNEQNILLFDQYKKNHSLLLNIEMQFLQLKDLNLQTLVLAPITGRVNNMNINIGYFLSNNALLEIIPQNENLLIEALIPSSEIDNIFLDGSVKIIINGNRVKISTRILGKIVYVSSDKIESISGKLEYYKIKVALPFKELSKINVNLYPGMKATIFIIKGRSTIIEYFYSPIKSIFYRSFI